MNPFDFLDELEDLGRLGRRSWGKRRGWGGRMGGWVFPALILGRIVQEVLEQQSRPQSSGSSWPQPQTPPAPPPSPWSSSETKPVEKTTRCVNCNQEVRAGYTFCPHCGRNITKRECAYCSRDIPPGAERCIGCGAPASFARRA